MLKTIVVLQNGTELSSGLGTENAIKTAEITQSVNTGRELSPGSTCSNEIELTVIAPAGKFSIAENDEFTVYREDESGTRHKIGVFISEKPTRAGANAFKVTAYDRVSLLDKDISEWLAGLGEWPYSMGNFVNMVCEECGVEFVTQDFPNSDYMVKQFSFSTITGRQIIKWAAQAAGKFCRATANGELEFAWYKPVSNKSIGTRELRDASVLFRDRTVFLHIPDALISSENDTADISGTTISAEYAEDTTFVSIPEEQMTPYYQNALKYETYQVEPVAKVQIKNSQDDIGTVYPSDNSESVNTYVVSGNHLLTAGDSSELVCIAQNLYEVMSKVSYTPCTVVVPAGFLFCAGDIIRIQDANGIPITVYIMTSTQKGQRQTLKCTGSARRQSSSAMNDQQYSDLAGKVLDLVVNVDGLRVENRNAAGRMANLSVALDGITAQVQQQNETINGVEQNITQIRQEASELQVSVQSIQTDGVKRVTTETGYTFGNDGLKIHRSGSDVENLLDDTGMYVKRSGRVVLQANNDGVEAVDVTVRNYLVIGDHARFEDYKDGTDSNRTACFWI